MARYFWRKSPWFVGRKPALVGIALVVLALMALACAPAAEPTAAPSGATPEVAAPTATPVEELVSATEQRPSEEGRYVEMAGLQVFVPKGFVAGGPIIPPDPREPRYGGVFNNATGPDPPSLDPYQTTSAWMQRPTSVVYERLVHFPHEPGIDVFKAGIVPGLAESWDVSKDFLKYTFHLHKGVKFQDVPPVNGREFNAEDVVFTYGLFTEPESIVKGAFANIERVEAVDRYIVVYHMKQVDPGLLSGIALTGRGYILPKEATQYNRKLTAVGTGPFIQAGDYEYKVGVTLRRNPDYWMTDQAGRKLPYLDGFKINVIPDSSARTAAFRTGKVDEGASTSAPQEVRNLLKTNPYSIVLERVGVQNLVGIGFRLDKEPWNDVRVRRALSLAINYEEWAQTNYEISSSPAPTINGYWVDEPNTPENFGEWYQGPDVARAKALLAEAGYPNGFTMTVEYYPYGQDHTATHELLGQYWKAIGVTSQIRALDYTVFRANLDKGSWTDIGGWAFNFPFPADEDSLLRPLVPGGPQNSNLGWLNDPEITALVQEHQKAYADPAKRKELVRQIRRLLLDRVYQIPWQYGHLFGVTQPWVRNYQSVTHALASEYARTLIPTWIDDAW
ncbi:MAG: ABC transporter substrate-binding protein, partial [Chloroflexi bacterium]|nr:ABC transporter substrate-binding protein [Chloroflexota bacterium]